MVCLLRVSHYFAENVVSSGGILDFSVRERYGLNMDEVVEPNSTSFSSSESRPWKCETNHQHCNAGLWV